MPQVDNLDVANCMRAVGRDKVLLAAVVWWRCARCGMIVVAVTMVLLLLLLLL